MPIVWKNMKKVDRRTRACFLRVGGLAVREYVPEPASSLSSASEVSRDLESSKSSERWLRSWIEDIVN